MVRVAAGCECWEGLGHIPDAEEWWIQTWASVTGSSLDSRAWSIDGQMLAIKVFTGVETMGLSAWDGVTTLEMVGPGRMKLRSEADSNFMQ